MEVNKILRQVREQRQFSIAQVADRTGISAGRLEDFEAGSREPSYNQLTALAGVYGVAPYIFASKTLPNLEPNLPDFRQERPRPAAPSPRGMHRIWAVENASEYTKQLMDALGFKPEQLTRSKPEPTIDFARKLRAEFEEWLQPRFDGFQFAGASEQKFLAAFRLYFEFQGNLVNINDAPTADYTGFYADPEVGIPSIFVNRKIYSKKAQLFTLLHEYCHYIIGAEGISDPFVSRNSTEAVCNRFAAEFLAPKDQFIDLVEHLPKDRFQSTDRLIKAVSNRALLSMHATGIRLVETGYLSQSALNSWLANVFKNPRVEKDDEPEVAGGHVHAKRLGELGYLPTFLSAAAIKARIIDRHDVVVGLGLADSIQDAAFDLAQRRFDRAAN
ncbi:helix-turn-helix domain-containing protein [Devosia salina]|uniref:ImmA/IrrE family metallo-endopeptidase n=1 Tax=Devosia salina TaxID=2860336 RepID=A0ABX8WFL7_9HYPH|nr:XRE family transcriptional regulator [Devosia salina]QYO77193.1 ImmA/IrrE family metallo-endopeptidase [Devosia salina]